VTPDPNRPFAVYVADSVVRAIGTAFVVRPKGRDVDVTLTQGAVDVTEIRGVETTLGFIAAGSAGTAFASSLSSFAEAHEF
jgi:ferric-dicitrate binding protein FerR (iron transport regulator)